jgi:hypothetical protein
MKFETWLNSNLFATKKRFENYEKYFLFPKAALGRIPWNHPAWPSQFPLYFFPRTAWLAAQL